MSDAVLTSHYDDVTMSSMASQITSLTQPFIRAQIKENIKAPRHWPLCGEFTGTDEFPAQMASYAENVSIMILSPSGISRKSKGAFQKGLWALKSMIS